MTAGAGAARTPAPWPPRTRVQAGAAAAPSDPRGQQGAARGVRREVGGGDGGGAGGRAGGPGSDAADCPARSARPAAGAHLHVHDNVEYPAILAEVADLHARLADAYRRLARAADIQLAAGRERALMGPVEAPSPVPRLLTVRDVAEILQVDAKTVRRWRSEGKLPPALVVGGVVRWPEEAIREWASERVGADR